MNLEHIDIIDGLERPDGYDAVIVETYSAVKKGKETKIHVRPINGQDYFDSSVDVECSREMRKKYPIGTMFLLWAKNIDREGTPIVYARYDWGYEIVNK